MEAVSKEGDYRLSNIVCIFYDFDGVMTDNRVLVAEDGSESVFVNRSDGLAVSEIKKLGIEQIIVSTEKNSVVEKRARKLGIEVIHGVDNKADIVSKICKEKGYDLAEVMFVGNDINDLSALDICGYKGCPLDAVEEVKEICDWISDKNGGYGVIRDLYGHLLSLKQRGF